MKLITLNVEGSTHLDTVMAFLKTERAEVVCLQEARTAHVSALRELKYHVTFLPTVLKPTDAGPTPEGILIASLASHKATSRWYHRPDSELKLFDKANLRTTSSRAYVLATVETLNKTYSFVVTHFTWTPNGGDPSEYQQTDLPVLFSLLQKEPPHVLCGDMNIPRGQSFLYDSFLKHYTDAVPTKYSSSLDKELHLLGSNPEKAILFSDYMVDYIFTQPPYFAENVRLEFGVSDHAAVVAHIVHNN